MPQRRLPAGKNSYDVFISYRSSDRAWAMALYDALKLAGWEPFLDQYDLVPGANLETSLTESLQASSSGVILWSSRTKDSKWCERERTSDDHSVRRTVDPLSATCSPSSMGEPLPLFARTDLYIDFVDSPEGPRGVNLLKLICGMRGVSLAPEAVEMAQKIDQDAQQILASINGAIEAGNPPRLREIGTSAEPGILASPGPVLAAAQGLISMGKNEEALEVLKNAYAYFPQSIRVMQLKGLALRRLRAIPGRYRRTIRAQSSRPPGSRNLGNPCCCLGRPLSGVRETAASSKIA